MFLLRCANLQTCVIRPELGRSCYCRDMLGLIEFSWWGYAYGRDWAIRCLTHCSTSLVNQRELRPSLMGLGNSSC